MGDSVSRLDEHFEALLAGFKRAAGEETARAQRELIAKVSGALDRLQAASNEEEWRTAGEESAAAFPGDGDSLELLSRLAALTRPAPARAANLDQNEWRLRAERFARVKVAEVQLYHSKEVRAGRASRDLYGALKAQIEAAREAFRERFLTGGNKIADYLHAELIATLANDDAELLGPGYPGPME